VIPNVLFALSKLLAEIDVNAVVGEALAESMPG